MSVNLYETFGNELTYKVTLDTLNQFLKTSTIKFPLPEASSSILSDLASSSTIDPVVLDAVRSRLIDIGFAEPNANAMAAVLISVAKTQNVSPMEYFEVNEKSLKLAIDTYKTINMLRPPGNRIGLVTPINNQKSRYNQIIKP